MPFKSKPEGLATVSVKPNYHDQLHLLFQNDRPKFKKKNLIKHTRDDERALSSAIATSWLRICFMRSNLGSPAAAVPVFALNDDGVALAILLPFWFLRTSPPPSQKE